MPPLETILAVSLAGLALSITPGPSMIYVLSRSVGQSRSAGLASAVGLCVGGIVLAIATAFGLAQVFQSSDWLVPVLRYVGSAYLVWLGIDMIRGAKSAAQVTLQTDSVKQQSVTKIMWQGVLVEVLNPKTVLFFALFLPPFINFHEGQDMSLVQLQLLILGILVPLTAIPADLVVAFAGGSLARLVNHRRQMRERMAWVCGLVLIGIAIHLHWPIL